MECIEAQERKTRMPSQKQNVYDTLKKQIIALELKPGDTLNESELIAQMGVSRTPIREAIMRLSDEGLVDIYPQRGTYVSKIDVGLVRELIYMRNTLETRVLCDLCDAGADVGRENLKFLFEAQNHAALAQDSVAFLKVDDEFHYLLFCIGGHGGIWNIIDRNRALHNRYRMLDILGTPRMQETIREHEKILDLIEARDKETLKVHLYKHHDCGCANSDLLMQRYAEYFIVG